MRVARSVNHGSHNAAVDMCSAGFGSQQRRLLKILRFCANFVFRSGQQGMAWKEKPLPSD